MYKKAVNSKYLSLIVISLFCLALCSCGFKLRGGYQLPQSMTAVVLESPVPSAEVTKQLKRHLRSAGIVVYETSFEGSDYFILRLTAGQNLQRILSVDNRGRAGELELRYSIRYSLQEPDSERFAKEKEIVIVREHLSDPLDPLGSSAEQALLRRDMEIEAARLIMEGMTVN